MANIRITRVREKEYIQVYEYFSEPEGKRKVKILKSFGRATAEARMEALLFKENYNLMKNMKDWADKGEIEFDLMKSLMVADGVIGAFLGLDN